MHSKLMNGQKSFWKKQGIKVYCSSTFEDPNSRDDLESHSVSVQTDHDDVDGAFRKETKDQSTQTDADAEEEDRKVWIFDRSK